MCLTEKIKGFLFSPTSAFKKEEKTDLGKAIKYLAIILIPISVMIALIGVIIPSAIPIPIMLDPTTMFFTMLVGIYVVGWVGAIVGGAILHIFAYLFGARKGLNQTIKAGIFAMTPTFLLGWIPVIGFLFSLWSIVLLVIGLKTLHNITTGKAVLILVTIIIISAALFVAILWPMMPGLLEMGSLGSMYY